MVLQIGAGGPLLSGSRWASTFLPPSTKTVKSISLKALQYRTSPSLRSRPPAQCYNLSGSEGGNLARNSHQPTAAGAHLPHFAKAMWGRPGSTALHSDKGLDVLYSTTALFVSLAPLGCLRPELRPRGALVEALYLRTPTRPHFALR